jgi:hypothetical protein
VSVVVAARDEREHLQDALATLLAQDYPDVEILIVDDRSTDGTGEVARAIAARDARVVPIRIDALPDGWLGKVHALHVATGRATGSWTLYTDADVHFAPGAIRHGVAVALERGLDHLAVGPDVRAGSILHQAATAAFLGSFSLGVRADRVGEPGSGAYAGVGAFNLVRREVFDRTPGFPWLRMEVVDDLGLGLLLHRAGARAALMSGRGLLEIDWYPTFRAMARGLEKNLFAVAGRYSVARTATILIAGALFLASPAVALAGPVAWPVRVAGAAALGSSLASAVAARRRSSLPLAALALAPLGQACLLWFLARSAAACLVRGGIDWRGTFYPLSELRAGRRVNL